MAIRRNPGLLVAEEPCQPLAKHEARSQKPDFDRLLAKSQDLGCLASRELFDVAEHEHHAILFVERSQGVVDVLSRFVAHSDFFGSLAPGSDVLGVRDSFVTIVPTAVVECRAGADRPLPQQGYRMVRGDS